MFTNFRRDRLIWGEIGAQKFPRHLSFFCKQYEMTFWQLCKGQFSTNLAMTRKSWLERRFWTEIYEKFPFRGHLPPKPKTCGSNRYLTQSRLQVKGCTAELYCLLHVSPRAREFPRSLQLVCTTYGCGAMGHQSAQFSSFGLFSPYKTPKTSGDQPAVQGLQRRMIPIFIARQYADARYSYSKSVRPSVTFRYKMKTA